MKKRNFNLITLILLGTLCLSACSAQETPVSSSETSEQDNYITSSVDFNAPDGSAVKLSVDFPSEISEFISLETEKSSFGEGIECTSVLFSFSHGEQSANIGTIYVFQTDAYNTLDPQAEPIPSQLFASDGLTVAFQNLQSQPFDLSSEEADMIDSYQAQIQATLDSIVLEKMQ